MDIRTLPARSVALFKRAYGRSRTRTIIAVVLALALLGLIVFALIPKGGTPETENGSGARTVELAPVSALSAGESSFSVIAQVQSRSEATIYTESSGQIRRLNRDLGDNVAAGTVIAEMENASQRASVAQARASVAAAEAALAKVKAGSRPEQIAILESSLSAARTGAVNALLGAYGTMEDAIRHTADLMISNPTTYAPTLNLTVTDTQLEVDIENARPVMTTLLEREAARANTLSATEGDATLIAEIEKTETEVRAARAFIDNIIEALGKSVTTPSVSASDIATWKSAASGARTSLTSTLASLASAKSGLISAQENLTIGKAGGTKEDIASAEASVAQAEGGLAAAYAALEKTIIRAPISGTINMLDLKLGDFKGAQTPVVTIANNGALEAVAQISEEESRRLAVGDTVTLGDARGVITRIAPAIDPSTQKIEVRIGISADTGLTNGASVIALFGETTTVSEATEIIIPLAAVKITVDGTNVFTVDNEQELVAHPVVLGTLLGDRVVIESGIAMSDVIVVDARGLKAGQKVATE